MVGDRPLQGSDSSLLIGFTPMKTLRIWKDVATNRHLPGGHQMQIGRGVEIKRRATLGGDHLQAHGLGCGEQ